MKISTILHKFCFLVLLAICLFALSTHAKEEKGCADEGGKKLGASFTDYTVPKRAAATVGEGLGFAALVIGVIVIAGVNTYYKVKSNPRGLPGYTQAIYMKDQ